MGTDAPIVGRGPETEAPSFEDVITGAVQEALDDEEERGHIVTDWVLIAEVIGVDGKPFSHIRYSTDEMMFSRALGLLEYGKAMVRKDIAEEPGEEDE